MEVFYDAGKCQYGIKLFLSLAILQKLKDDLNFFLSGKLPHEKFGKGLKE